MSELRKPVIVNQISEEFGRHAARHPSSPKVIDDLSPAEPWQIAAEADILVTGGFSAWKQTPPDWRAPAGLKWIQSQTTGIENYPPSLMVGKVMTCGRGLNAAPIAEFVFAAMLRVEKRLEQTRARAAEDWQRPDIGRLYGKTLGLIGYGSIGQAIARRALAFDMHVIVNRRSNWQGENGITAYGDAADVFSRADHLVLAAPLTPQTAGMIDGKLLAAAKPGLHLINISRGGLVDQQALIEALNGGLIGQATLDVTSPEPLPDGHALYAMQNVFISPHISWSGGSQDEAFLERFLANLDAYVAGQPLSHTVDPVAGY